MLDILFIGAHPDDEQSVSGLLLKAKSEGLSTGVLILTQGEAGGFATKETRVKEFKNSCNILNLDYKKILDFGDSCVEFSTQTVDMLIPYLVETKPRIVITIHPDDYHPDHRAVSKIVDRTVFVAGLKKNIGNVTWHPCQLLYVSLDPRTNNKRPDILINIDSVIDGKIQSLKCYESQLIEKPLLIGSKYLGNLAGCKYGEGLYLKRPFTIDKISYLFNDNEICR